MKLIEALKGMKYQLKKADDLKAKIAAHCADLDCETALYPNQKEVVDAWIQSHSDCLKEAARLNYCILKTNVLTKVTIEIGGNFIEKSIAEWILRRKKLAAMEESAWKSLGDRNLKEGNIQQSNGQVLGVKIRRYYDPKLRDAKVALYNIEPSLIDMKLEIVNCVTDLME